MRVPITVHFDEADPGGILFFGRILTLAHRVFEEAVVPALVPRWDDWFRSDAFMVPIRHAEATFSQPMHPGRRHAAEIEIASVGTTSFEVRTQFVEEAAGGDRLCAETRVTHVFTDPATFLKREIPPAVRKGLEALQAGPAGLRATAGDTSPGASGG